MNQDVLVEVKDFKKYFTINKYMKLRSLDSLNFKIKKGQTFSLVGETGCGKSTCGRTLVNALPPSEGAVFYDGKDISHMDEYEKQCLRKKVKIIFQNPCAALNPQLTVHKLIAEQVDTHFPARSYQAQQNRISFILEQIGLDSHYRNELIYELPDNQLYLVAIALALAASPELIVCDEPISASNDQFQTKIISLLKELQNDLGLTYLFISSRLSMVKHVSDQIGIMHLGILVELTNNQLLSSKKMHPYTKSLMSESTVNANNKRAVKGETVRLSKGCSYVSQCLHAGLICQKKLPEMIEIEANHFVACHLYD